MFLTINPDTLTDSELWTYRDLQLISTQLGLKANLKRSKLIGILIIMIISKYLIIILK